MTTVAEAARRLRAACDTGRSFMRHRDELAERGEEPGEFVTFGIDRAFEVALERVDDLIEALPPDPPRVRFRR